MAFHSWTASNNVNISWSRVEKLWVVWPGARWGGEDAPHQSTALSLNPAIVKQWGDIEDSSITSDNCVSISEWYPGRNSESQVVKLTWWWRSQYLLDWTNSNYSLIIHSRTKRQAVNSQKFRVSIKVKHNRVSQFPFTQWPSCEDWWDQVYLVFHLNCKMSIKPFQNLFFQTSGLMY